MNNVAICVGAWDEKLGVNAPLSTMLVAICVGAWDEKIVTYVNATFYPKVAICVGAWNENCFYLIFTFSR